MRQHPWYRAAVGGFFIIMWVAASVFTILTDESLIEGGAGDIKLSWDILLQPWYLVHGEYAGIHAWAVLGAWMIFSAYVLLSILDSIYHSRLLKSVVYILIGIDGIANYLYFHALPPIYQILMSGLIFMVIVYALNIGLTLLLSAIEEIGERRRGE